MPEKNITLMPERGTGGNESSTAGPSSIPVPAEAEASLSELLGRFSDSLALLAVAHTSLASKELAGTGDEEVALHRVLEGLRAVYNDLDTFSARATSSFGSL